MHAPPAAAAALGPGVERDGPAAGRARQQSPDAGPVHGRRRGAGPAGPAARDGRPDPDPVRVRGGGAGTGRPGGLRAGRARRGGPGTAPPGPADRGRAPGGARPAGGDRGRRGHRRDGRRPPTAARTAAGALSPRTDRPAVCNARAPNPHQLHVLPAQDPARRHGRLVTGQAGAIRRFRSTGSSRAAISSAGTAIRSDSSTGTPWSAGADGMAGPARTAPAAGRAEPALCRRGERSRRLPLAGIRLRPGAKECRQPRPKQRSSSFRS